MDGDGIKNTCSKASLLMLISGQSTSDPRRIRRQSRLAAKPNPFLCFRVVDQGDAPPDDEPHDEALVAITKYWTGSMAKCLFDDGSELNADGYEMGPNGFVIAVWCKPPMKLELDVLNNRLVDGAIQIAAPPKPPAKPMKKPAAKKRRIRGKSPAEVPTGADFKMNQNQIKVEKQNCYFKFPHMFRQVFCGPSGRAS